VIDCSGCSFFILFTILYISSRVGIYIYSNSGKNTATTANIAKRAIIDEKSNSFGGCKVCCVVNQAQDPTKIPASKQSAKILPDYINSASWPRSKQGPRS